jgi:poly(3-hydroxybutyrate) depolymerase
MQDGMWTQRSIRSKTMVLFFSVTISLQSMPRAYGSGATHPSADKPGALIIDGYSRRYTIHIPPNVGRRPPVVFMLHGRGGTKEQAEGEFGWRELADREGGYSGVSASAPNHSRPCARQSYSCDRPFLAGFHELHHLVVFWICQKLARTTSSGRWGFLDTLDCEDSGR